MASDFYDHMGGCGFGSRPCANCESEPVDPEFGYTCSQDCWDEYNGEGEYAED
jgi:hypothetical protein